jgi:hypothetical protein
MHNIIVLHQAGCVFTDVISRIALVCLICHKCLRLSLEEMYLG